MLSQCCDLCTDTRKLPEELNKELRRSLLQDRSPEDQYWQWGMFRPWPHFCPTPEPGWAASVGSLWQWPTNCCQEDTRARDKTSLQSTMMGTEEIRPGPGSHKEKYWIIVRRKTGSESTSGFRSLSHSLRAHLSIHWVTSHHSITHHSSSLCNFSYCTNLSCWLLYLQLRRAAFCSCIGR